MTIEALQKFHHFLGDKFKIEYPTDAGNQLTLWELSQKITLRLIKIFLKDKTEKRPVFGGTAKFQMDPHWYNYILFYEYFNGDNGAGIGASHQTVWTGLIAKLIQQYGE